MHPFSLISNPSGIIEVTISIPLIIDEVAMIDQSCSSDIKLLSRSIPVKAILVGTSIVSHIHLISMLILCHFVSFECGNDNTLNSIGVFLDALQLSILILVT